MEISTAKATRLPRARNRLARHFAAMIALAIVLATLLYKNLDYQKYTGRIDLGTGESRREYGWPRPCLGRIDRFAMDPYARSPSRTITSRWQTDGLPMAMDFAVAVAVPLAPGRCSR